MGEETAHLLAKNFPTIQLLLKATKDELVVIDGIGEVVADKIIEWQGSVDEQALLKKLLHYLNVTNDAVVKQNLLHGQSFVFTGTLEKLTRPEAQDLVRKFGGVVAGSVSKKTDYVVVGSEAGSKAKEAKNLGVKILTEAEFLRLVA